MYDDLKTVKLSEVQIRIGLLQASKMLSKAVALSPMVKQFGLNAKNEKHMIQPTLLKTSPTIQNCLKDLILTIKG